MIWFEGHPFLQIVAFICIVTCLASFFFVFFVVFGAFVASGLEPAEDKHLDLRERQYRIYVRVQKVLDQFPRLRRLLLIAWFGLPISYGSLFLLVFLFGGPARP